MASIQSGVLPPGGVSWSIDNLPAGSSSQRQWDSGQWASSEQEEEEGVGLDPEEFTAIMRRGSGERRGAIIDCYGLPPKMPSLVLGLGGGAAGSGEAPAQVGEQEGLREAPPRLELSELIQLSELDSLITPQQQHAVVRHPYVGAGFPHSPSYAVTGSYLRGKAVDL